MEGIDAAPPSFRLRLQATSKAQNDSETITQRIRHIVEAKGHLKDVTERTLLGGDTAENGASLDDEEDMARERSIVGTLEHTTKIKGQMLDMIRSAHEQSMYTVDFVSLLLSRYSAAAVNSMSEGLKAAIPPGTIAFQKQPPIVLSEAERVSRALVAQGQRLVGMTQAADALLDAATRLQSEVKREKSYWHEVLTLADEGWPIRRHLRGNKHQLGVQLGSLEAIPLYRSKGFVAVDRQNDGTAILNKQLDLEPQSLRVRCMKDGEIFSTNIYGRNSDKSSDSIATQAKAARDSLFDQELFHECSREAQNLVAHGVDWRDSTIRIATSRAVDRKEIQPSSEIILIDLIPQGGGNASHDNGENDLWADEIATALKLSLLHTYRLRLERRSRAPVLLNVDQRASERTRILWHFIVQRNVRSVITSMRDYERSVWRTCKRAGLKTPSVEQIDILSAFNLSHLTFLSSPATLFDNLSRKSAVTLAFRQLASSGTINVELVADPTEPSGFPRILVKFGRSTTTKPLGQRIRPDLISDQAKSDAETFVYHSEQEFLMSLDGALAEDVATNIALAMPSQCSTTINRNIVEVHAAHDRELLRLRVVYKNNILHLHWRKGQRAGDVRWGTEHGDQTIQDIVMKLLARVKT